MHPDVAALVEPYYATLERPDAGALHIGRHPDADAMLGGKPAAARQDVSTDVFNELRRRFPGVTASRFVQVTAGEWIRPYLFFALGLLRDWEFLNDDTVAAV